MTEKMSFKNSIPSLIEKSVKLHVAADVAS